MTTGTGSISSENCVICHIDTAVSTNPKQMISRLSMRLMIRPTMNIEIMTPTPRGAVTSPVVNAG